ncbi:MAG: sigma-70 family RNA polymerase sigma factor [Bacteroidales bacterium]|nr:sigma-70 family RNA polymerase sigma factor [Bacteroidales bacterium]
MQSDKEIIRGIASNHNGTLNYIYKELYPYVEAYVLHHGGTDDHARDVFQDALYVIFKKIKEEGLTLHCKFSTYLYAVCKNMWIQNRKKHYLRLNKLKEMPHVAESEPAYGDLPAEESKALFEKHFNRLGPDCQKLLQLYFNGFTIKEICQEMGISSIENTSDKKYRCKKNLIERIKNDPKFRKFKK